MLGGVRFINHHFSERGIALELFSPTYRFADVAFARTVDPGRYAGSSPIIRCRLSIPACHPPAVAGHRQGNSTHELAGELAFPLSAFLAIGDSRNDIGMLRTAGTGAVVANVHDEARDHAGYVAEKKYSEGFLEIIEKYRPYFLAR
jgi:hypothetical protein